MLILILLLLSIQNSILPTYASTYDTYFARVMYDDVFLYKTPVDISSYENVMFVIPKTYFVELTEEAGTDFYKANYLDFTGYVKKVRCKQLRVALKIHTLLICILECIMT